MPKMIDTEAIIAALRANPEAAGQVCGALQRQFAPEREAIALARAEQAEHSLAASERALAALRTRITDLVATWGPPTHDPDACPSVAAGVGPCFRCAVSAALEGVG